MTMFATDVTVTVTLTIHVPRDANGTLAEGAQTVVSNADAVAAVEEFTATGVTPRLNDLTVDATARLTLAAARTEDAARTALEDALGVTVDSLTLEPPDNPTSTPTPETHATNARN